MNDIPPANSPSQSRRKKPAPAGKHFYLLRVLRIIIAAIVLGLFTIAFANIFQLLPNSWGHTLAEFQFTPALQSTLSGVIVPSAIILAGLLAATLLFGRVYCSFLCPLGIFQDVLIRISRMLKTGKAKAFRYAPSVRWIRGTVLALVILSMLTGIGNLLMWLDPYSQFGRMMSMVFRPTLAEINNVFAGLSDTFYHIPPDWIYVGAVTFIPLALLAVIWIMALRKGRLYCNTLCPVGAFLGLISRYSAFRPTIDKSACIKCGMCMKSCKSQCIDLKKGDIDYSRCVNCFDCSSSCNERGIHYRFTWRTRKEGSPKDRSEKSGGRTGKKTEKPQAPSAEQVMNALPSGNRRAFLGATLLGAAATINTKTGNKFTRTASSPAAPSAHAISPPGSKSVRHFLDFCTACHLCLEACPTKCLRPAYMEYGLNGILKPHMDFSEGFCNFDCTSCADVCPAGAIRPIDLAEKKHTRIAKAELHLPECIAACDKTDCGACSEHCPTKALDMVDIQQPTWDADSCILCGDCTHTCKVKAVSIVKDRIVIDYDKCTGCGDCIKTCQGSALEMKKSRWNIRIPKLSVQYCIGCGACEFACPVKAVRIHAIPVHEQAEVLVQKQVEDPNAGKDFAF